jgi:small subunit ribosomal protein S16
MSVVMRMTRIGAKKKPFYRVVVADSRRARDGKFIEILGTFDPLKNPEEIKIDTERAQVWLKNGAQPSDTVRELLVKCGVIEKKN